jgi:hypothetical protein
LVFDADLGSGMKKFVTGIRDKHSGSATLDKPYKNSNCDLNLSKLKKDLVMKEKVKF